MPLLAMRTTQPSWCTALWWINTSFNWVSFRGDPNRTFRMEEGTLVQIPSEVDKAYKQYVEVLETDAKP